MSREELLALLADAGCWSSRCILSDRGEGADACSCLDGLPATPRRRVTALAIVVRELVARLPED